MRRIALLILPLLILAACSIDTSSLLGSEKREKKQFPEYGSSHGGLTTVPASRKTLPWESWAYGYDLNGRPLTHIQILRGDEMHKSSALTGALDSYNQAYTTKLTPAEQEALVLRLASTQLSLDRADEALATMSNFYRANSRAVDSVDPKFSLVFAYAYGRSGDIDQSLAWFSRSFRVARGGPVAASTEQGVRLLMRAVPSTRLIELVRTWYTDSFVHAAIGEERRRRAQRGYQEPAGSFAERFWSELRKEPAAPISVAQSGDVLVVGALLPLSGRYAALGVSLQRGIELAFEAHKNTAQVKLVFEDTAGDPLQAAAKTRELISRDGASAILGPLLSEEALAVSSITRDARVLLLTFSKKNDFATGQGVYRLGPTAQSQVQSLIEGVRSQFGLNTFGLAYPQDESGAEFAKQFRETLANNGLTLVFETSYSKDDPAAFPSVASAVEGQNIQALFIPDGLVNASRIAASLSHSVRNKVILLGAANWDDFHQLSRSQGAMRRAVFLSPFFNLSKRPYVTEFISVYSKSYGGGPDFLAAQAFDAATMLFTAAARGAGAGTALEDELQHILLYEGLTGKISVDAGGEFRRNFTVLQLRDDGLVELTADPSTIDVTPQLAAEHAVTTQVH